MYFYNLAKMKFKQKYQGIWGLVITGTHMQMTVVRLDFGVSTHHSHPNEQMGYILKGEVEITINEEKKLCRAGDAYVIPSHTPHGFKVLSKTGVEYLEMFSPPKQENTLWYEKNL